MKTRFAGTSASAIGPAANGSACVCVWKVRRSCFVRDMSDMSDMSDMGDMSDMSDMSVS